MNKKYYDCYSYNQMKFLRENGEIPVRAGTHHRTKNTIWVFVKNNRLDELLSEWTNEKNKTGRLLAI